MTASGEELPQQAGQLAARMAEWLESERLAVRFVDSYVMGFDRRGLRANPTEYRQRLALLTQEALLAMAVFFLTWCSLHFQKKYWLFFRRPDWETLGAVWEGFTAGLEGRLADEQKEFLASFEMSWPPTGSAASPPAAQVAERLGRTLDPARPDDARYAAEKLLPLLEKRVSELASQVLGT